VLPGHRYTPEEVLRIIWHRKWLLILPLVVGVTASFGYARRMPNLYTSETTILVVPQRIPETYVRSTVTGGIADRLATIKDQIMSRSRLERIILDLDLYPEQRRTGIMEDIVAGMQRDIRVEPGRESFRVSFISRDAVTAQKTADRLAALFIDENLRDRENLAENTSEFIDSQLEDAKRRLVEHEKKLEDYQRRYSGELPTQAAANMQAIQNIQMQLGALADSMDRDRDRRLLLERQVADLENSDPAEAAVAEGSNGGRESASTPAQRYEAAKAALAVLRTQKTSDHPDVKALERSLKDLESQATAAAAAQPPSKDTVVSTAQTQRQRRVRELVDQIADIDRGFAERRADESKLRSALAQYQSRLEAVPTRQAELVGLTRDYSTLQGSYQSLLAKREEAKIAVNLERRNIGEQFRVLDAAKVPQRPFSPDRPRIYLSGAAAGLILGLLLVAVLEYRDSTFKREEEVVRVLALPVLAIVPVMISDRQRGATQRRTLLIRFAVCGVLVAGVAAVVLWTLKV